MTATIVPHDTSKSWQQYKKNLNILSTGTSTMSKRPRLEPEEPCYIERGDGCRVWDIDGNEYIDYRNGLGPVLLGYRYPAVDNAIRRQLDKGIVFGHPTLLEAEVAELLVAQIPCAEKVRYLKTGGEAVAACIKLARAATGKKLILQCGYNGWINSVARGASVLPRVQEDVPRGVLLENAKLHRMLPWGDIAAWEKIFAEEGDDIAAAIIAMDYCQPEKAHDFLPALRTLTEKHGCLLITDEIVTGFRIATGGLHEYSNTAVDMAVFSKGVANGMPLSVMAGKAELMDEFNTATVSSTFSGETLSLAAAKACLELYQRENVIAHLKNMGAIFQDGLNELFDQYDYPLHCVGIPSCSILTEKDDFTKPASGEPLEAFYRAAYKHGVSLYAVNYPNYSFTEEDVTESLKRMQDAFEDLAGA